MAAYYNEFDPFAAAWLRELIKAGHIADGEVDERSITEVKADEIKGFTQCHFFAGIGGWSLALRQAMWCDDRPVWTGSAPCQPFSSAGRQKGKADERHLFPTWLGLITECMPSTIFGEQVSSAVAHGWLDDVYQGLEAQGYAIGAAVLPACSIGAPHRRDRLWFVADASCRRFSEQDKREIQQSRGAEAISTSSAMANTASARSLPAAHSGIHTQEKSPRSWDGESERQGYVGDTDSKGCPNLQRCSAETQPSGWGFTDYAGWWDIEPNVGRVANGVPNRVGKLRGFGNAIVPQIAAEFIKAFEGAINEMHD